MKIYAPVKNATGVWCNVHFKNGVGETDNPHLIEWFKKHGYAVDAMDDTPSVVIEPSNNEVDLESMTPIEIREWAKANGFGSKIKNIRNKEKLLEIIRG
jgi:hypothetical protein